MIEELQAAAERLPQDWVKSQPGRQLRLLREARGVSQRQLAEQARLCQSEISRMESGGDACLSAWRRLYEALGWDAVLVPTGECEETEGWLQDCRAERMERQSVGLRTGRRRFR